MIKELIISGFRGFGQPCTIDFSLPDNKTPGSGLTLITGANNAGKTTIIEAIRAFNHSGKEAPSFSEGRRNTRTSGIVSLKLKDENEKEYAIFSVKGGSSTEKSEPFSLEYYVLQSRRSVPFEFGRNTWDKKLYISQAQRLDDQRSALLQNFEARIFQIEKQKEIFDGILSRILGDNFQWYIEQRDSGQYYIKYSKCGMFHSSEGVGDGIWSIFTICAALFDSKDNSTIIIDEPELSVHPALQKRLADLFIEYSKTRQIVICTHSPYFVDWRAIINGAQLVRVAMEDSNSTCYSISNDCRQKFAGILCDLNNPHTLGIEANEALFLEDNIILVEGQEDVVILKRISRELDISIKGNFFGWGVGGAPKMQAFLELFKDLGYKHIVTILDGDKAEEAALLAAMYSPIGYKIITLEKDDIRDKKERSIQAKEGITTEKGELKAENRKYAIDLISRINSAF